MKKLILLLLFIPLVSCDTGLRRGETIDKMTNDVQALLPYDFNNGIVWTESINENNMSKVQVYNVSDEGLSVVDNSISKSQMIEDLKAMPSKKGYKIFQKKKIISIWRYYHNDALIKEIIINPEDWE